MRFGRVTGLVVPGSWQDRVVKQFREERGEPEPAPAKRVRGTRHAWRRHPIEDLDDESDACRCPKCELVIRYRRGGRNGGLVLEESKDYGETWTWCLGASPGVPSRCRRAR